MTENYFSNREGYKVAAVRICQRALFVNSALYVFFEGKGIEAHIKWWNPAQVSRTVPSNALVALLNKGPITYLLRRGFYPLYGRKQWVMLSISLTDCQYLATVMLFYTTFDAAHLPWDSPWTISVCLDVPHMLAYWKRYGTGSWHPRELWICM